MIRNIKLNVDPKSKKYPADDVPRKVLKWLEENKRYVEPQREDITEGQVVVILGGKHNSKRGVLVKKLPKNLILVSGSSEIGGVTFTVLNQRYVLPVSVFIPLEKSYLDSIKVNEKAIKKIKDWTAENAQDLAILNLIDLEGKQEQLNAIISSECAKTKGMKTYFSTPFTLPKGIDPMSAFY